nr:hypothetical protein [Tanacetum cinerariifolium]
NLNGYNEVQNVGNQVAQNPRVQNIGYQNGLIGVQRNGLQNQIGNGNLVAVRAEGNAAGQNANQISAPVYDSDGSAEVHEYYDRYNNENMFTHDQEYNELLQPIPEPQPVPQNDNEVISEVTGVEQGGKTVEQHPANFKETRALYESLYQNLAVEVEKVNSNYLQQPMPNPEYITDLTIAMNMALTLMAKAFKLNYLTPTNNNQRISSNPRNMQIAQPGQNAGNPVGYNDVIRNQVIQNAVQNLRVQNVGNQNGLIGVQGNGNQSQIRNGNLVGARAEGNAAGQNGNQIRCYNCRGEEGGIQLQAEEYDLMAAAADLDEIEEVNANCI